ncbi:outer membrane lipoprotein-sorting protein [Marinithermus hydrothermalis]|uniref:Uncharacterized protein TP-0789 domain-containing protein n=1 Tax=Marinithermus hydrothermalis (strain DSM 14884 / JCM 11576 / T1) TaxID=869210 RepID=F2NN82_MARHT|nr:outer membrane lipoprotein-sorting protein [Marinithermus hydrothermalis]AEB12821.1 hypothetical protein Marky_2096 [Marinithermus hydrothermalis DSM 14884]
MRKGILATAVLGLGLTLAVSGEEVMQQVDARPTPTTLHGTMTMELVDKRGKSLTRQIELWAKDDEKMLIKFQAPADVKGTAFLALKRPDGSDEMKLYLPALKKVRRIAGSQRKGAFMGSDFTYDDISRLGSLDIEDYTHTLLREESSEEGTIYVVESTPKPGVNSSYEKLIVWVPETTYVPVKIEFYKKGRLYKVLTADRIQPFANGRYQIPTRLVMENVQAKHKTVLTLSDLEVDAEIPDTVFTERFMKR